MRPAAVWAALIGAVFFAASAGAAGAAGGHLAKFEPAQGCYIGAFIEKDDHVNGDIQQFEGLTGKKHASYFTYCGYGHPFPAEWVAKVKARHAAPHIAFEPNNGLDEVNDDDYLRAWARDAAHAECPIFLRFASEMNGPWTAYSKDPIQYKDKFRMVARVMREEAPNVAMVWTPFETPQRLINLYYPGDDSVDWVGINIYSVYLHDGDPKQPANTEDPAEFLRYIYNEYSDRKPIQVSEFAATSASFSKGTETSTVDFAIAKMKRFYTSLIQEFPRVKSVNWFCMNTIKAGLANNNYSILGDKRVLDTYSQLVSDTHFLSNVSYDPRMFGIRPEAPGPVISTLGAAGITLHRKNADDDLITSSGAVAASLDQPWLRGLKEGDVVHGDLIVRVQLPVGLEARGLIWIVDGRTVALTNTAPYRVSVPFDRLGAGKHTAQVQVMAKDDYGTIHSSPEVHFTLEP